MPPRSGKQTTNPRRMRGFERASGLLNTPIRKASETRGFAESRLLTHWSEVVGEDIAAVARPVDVSYSRGGFGATLTLLTTGSRAPMLQMQEPQLRAKINAVYGYAAISRIRFTQTAPTGFADGQAEFTPAPKQAAAAPTEASREQAEALIDDVTDPALRDALAALGANVLTRSRTRPEKSETPE